MMKKVITSIALTYIISFPFGEGLGGAYAQAPVIQWQKSLGGTGDDDAFDIKQTADRGYIIAGQAKSTNGDVTTGNHGGFDYWIVKLDSIGTLQWQKGYGGSADDYPYSIQQTVDGGYIIAGNVLSTDGDVSGNHGNSDYWVLKLNSTGDTLWTKTLGGSAAEIARSIQQTTDGGYIVAGYSYSSDGDVSGNHGSTDGWIVKLDTAGNIQWQKCLGGSWGEAIESIQQTADGGYIAAGNSKSNDGDVSGNHDPGNTADYWVVKLDTIGNLQWQKCLGGSGNTNDYARIVRQTTDNGYIVGGDSYSNDGDVSGNHGFSDYWVVKLDTTGNLQWQKCLGGSSDENVGLGSSLQQTTDGGYIIAGQSSSTDGDITGHHSTTIYYDHWIVKLDTLGTIEWQKSLGSNGGEGASAIQQTADGGYILAGNAGSNGGDITGFHGFYDYWIVKLGEGTTGIENVTVNNNEINIYPNPAQSVIIIDNLSGNSASLLITDIAGKIVYTATTAKTTETVNTHNFGNGIYFIQIENNGAAINKKFVVNR